MAWSTTIISDGGPSVKPGKELIKMEVSDFKYFVMLRQAHSRIYNGVEAENVLRVSPTQR